MSAMNPARPSRAVALTPPSRSGGLRSVGNAALVVLGALGALACGAEEEERTLEPVQLAMTSNTPPIFGGGEGDELTLYEVKRSVLFPIRMPDDGVARQLRQGAIAPFPASPWVTNDEIEVQVTYTLTNLDEQTHDVELLIDPHNEFGRYWPGFQLVDEDDGEFAPNLSGVDEYFELPGTGSGEASRRHGTFTFEDMDELAVDFATVINIIENVPPPDPDAENAITPTALVNHALHWQNRHRDTPLTARYVPAFIPGLTGIDLGLRTREPANLAIEIVVELRSNNQEDELIIARGQSLATAYQEPEIYWTVAAM